MNGKDALEVNKRLASLGFLSQEDCTSEYTANSERAVAEFQSVSGLEPTGIVDAMTRMILM